MSRLGQTSLPSLRVAGLIPVFSVKHRTLHCSSAKKSWYRPNIHIRTVFTTSRKVTFVAHNTEESNRTAICLNKIKKKTKTHPELNEAQQIENKPTNALFRLLSVSRDAINYMLIIAGCVIEQLEKALVAACTSNKDS